jgi:predicted transcriptional regulator of viral defense system
MARVLAALYDQSQSTFTLADAAKITGLSLQIASSLLHKAAARGVISRIKPGLFTIVPPELGSSVEYSGDPYLVPQKLAGETSRFVSHASAMEIHRMVTQPQFVVFTSSTKRILNRILNGTEFHFVLIKPTHFFGGTKHCVTKQETVQISDLERTVIDGLRPPEYCGGVTDVAKGLWMRHQDMKTTTLMGYAHRLGVGAVIRRLGYLLEYYRIASDDELAPSSMTVWEPGAEPLPAKPWKGQGRPPKRLRRDSQHHPVSVKALALALPASAWKDARKTRAGGRPRK